MAEPEESIRRRLEELGVGVSPEELREIASAYPALLAWMGMAEEQHVDLRSAATMLAVKRVADATTLRGLYP